MSARALALTSLLLAACGEIPFDGAPCPCADGYQCCPETNTCQAICPLPEPGPVQPQPGLPPAPPARPEALVGTGTTAQGDTVYWYEDGTYRIREGDPSVHAGWRALIGSGRYHVASGRAPTHVVGIAARGGHAAAWYVDGTVSVGTIDDLTDGLVPFSLPPARTPAEIVEMAVVAPFEGSGGPLQTWRVCAFFADGGQACGSPEQLTEVRPDFVTHPRQGIADIAGIESDASGRLWTVYADGAISEGTPAELGLVRYRPGPVAGFGMGKEATFVWYRSGLVRRYQGEPAPGAQPVWAAQVALGQATLHDVVAMAVDGASSPPSFHAWLRDGSLLTSTTPTFEMHTVASDVGLPANQSWSDVLGIAIDERGDVYSWYRDGTVAGGEPTHLATFTPSWTEWVALADGQNADTVADIAVFGDGYVWTRYVDGAMGKGNIANLGRGRLVDACDPAIETCAPTTCGPLEADDCPLGCHPQLPRCYDIAPSNGLESHLDTAASGALLVLPQGEIDTDDGIVRDASGALLDVPSAVLPAVTGGAPIRAFTVAGAVLGDVRVRGTRALAIVSNGDIVIDGVLDASADGVTPGPGARPESASCTGAPGQSIAAEDLPRSSGGGGAAHRYGGRAGGALEASDQAIPGGAAGVTGGYFYLRPLRGGCRGGGLASNPYRGGGGGGAVQLVSRTRIVMTASGAIDVTGGGGQSGVVPAGGGGGSGGGVLAEAPTIELAAGARIVTGGGGGGGACGAPGSDGLLSGEPAPGGKCDAPHLGSGGVGGVTWPAADGFGSDAIAGDAPSGGGGGGGGGGLIVLRTVIGQLSYEGASLTALPMVPPIELR